MIEKLKNTYAILNNLDEANSKKFNFKDVQALNNILASDINNYIKNEDFSYSKNNIEINKLALDIISKIDSLESRILPKANLISSFSNTKV